MARYDVILGELGVPSLSPSLHLASHLYRHAYLCPSIGLSIHPPTHLSIPPSIRPSSRRSTCDVPDPLVDSSGGLGASSLLHRDGVGGSWAFQRFLGAENSNIQPPNRKAFSGLHPPGTSQGHTLIKEAQLSPFVSSRGSERLGGTLRANHQEQARTRTPDLTSKPPRGSQGATSRIG